MNIAIVILNWNGKDNSIECLRSIEKLSLKCLSSHEKGSIYVVFVDNNSTDGSVEEIQNYGFNVQNLKIIKNSKNLGFAGGNNVGIKYALGIGAEYIWILNNDTVLHPNALDALIHASTVPSSGIIGSKIYFEKGYEFHRARYSRNERGCILWYAGGIIDWDNMYASHRGVDEVDSGQYDKREETAFVTGCSMMVKKDVFTRCGLLDEKYFLYLEDADFCLRAQKRGFKLLYEPDSVLWHKNAGSTGRPGHQLHEYYFTRNRIRFGFKYAPFRTKLALLKEALTCLVSSSKIRKKAVFDALFCLYGGRIIWEDPSR